MNINCENGIGGIIPHCHDCAIFTGERIVREYMLMNKYSRLFSNTLTFALGSFGSKLIVFLLMALYTRVLPTPELGAVDLIVQAANVLIPLASLSISEGVVRFGLEKDYNKSDVFSVGIITTILGLCCLLILFPLVFLIDILSPYALLLYIYVAVASIKLVTAQFVRAKGWVRLYAIDGFLDTLVMVLLNVLFLVVLKLGIVGYMLSIVLADFLSILFLFWMGNLRKYIKFSGIDPKIRSIMIRYSIPMIPTTIMWWITSVSDRFIVTYMMGEGANGIYSVANKLPTIITIISGIFSQAWQISAVSENNSKSRARFYEVVFNTYQSIVYVSAAGILLLIKPVTQVYYGFAYLESYKCTPFLVLSVVFCCFVTFLGSVYVATKRTKRSLVTTTVGAVMNIVLNILLIPVWGLNGAAFSTFVSYLVVFIIRAIDTKLLVGMRMNWTKVILNFLLLFTMGGFIFIEPPFMLLYLAFIFCVITAINFKTGLKAVSSLLQKRRERQQATV